MVVLWLDAMIGTPLLGLSSRLKAPWETWGMVGIWGIGYGGSERRQFITWPFSGEHFQADWFDIHLWRHGVCGVYVVRGMVGTRGDNS